MSYMPNILKKALRSVLAVGLTVSLYADPLKDCFPKRIGQTANAYHDTQKEIRVHYWDAKISKLGERATEKIALESILSEGGILFLANIGGKNQEYSWPNQFIQELQKNGTFVQYQGPQGLLSETAESETDDITALTELTKQPIYGKPGKTLIVMGKNINELVNPCFSEAARTVGLKYTIFVPRVLKNEVTTQDLYQHLQEEEKWTQGFDKITGITEEFVPSEEKDLIQQSSLVYRGSDGTCFRLNTSK